MNHRDKFRLVQDALGVPSTGIPNDQTKFAFQDLWDAALEEFRKGAVPKPSPPPLSRSKIPMLVSGETFPIVGHRYDAAGISGYIAAAKPDGAFQPIGTTVHHTASPSLHDRPVGFIAQHMHNLRSFYMGLGWNKGPHFFVDDHGIWPFTPLWLKGIHAVSFNASHVGIEMLGDYDDEDPWHGRGLVVLENTRALILALEAGCGFSRSMLRFHRDDPQTNKTCPGTRIKKDAFLSFLAQK